jgi:hypothetical protein
MSNQYVNDGKDWSELDIADLRGCAERGITLEGAATLLGRDLLDVAQMAEKLRLTLPFASRDYLPR